MIKHSIRQRVLYGHTDQMQVVYYGRYFEYFEAGRNELLRELDLPYYRMENSGLYLPVIESHANYKGSFTYDDWVNITTSLPEIPTMKIRIEYELKKDDGTLLVTGHTVHVFVEKLSGRPVRVPQDIIEVFTKYDREHS